MRKFIISQSTTNRLLAYASIVMIIVQSILSYFMEYSLHGALVTFGLAAAMFALPLGLYFIKPSSASLCHFPHCEFSDHRRIAGFSGGVGKADDDVL